MGIQTYKRPKQTRMRIVSRIRNFVWTTICLAGTAVIVWLLIQWCTPWLSTLSDTVMK